MRRKYDRQGLLAVRPQAFFEMFFEPPTRENGTVGEVAIVEIQGPLDHHGGGWCDSYDDILERVDAACMTAAAVVVLKLDSPGGDASGCFETARAIREKCAAAGKKLVAYVDGQACSAAYALACAASEIVTSETGILGSIGVINCRVDLTESDKQYGVRVAFVASGARKTDGHPHAPITEAELASTQRVVDALADSFFALVEDLRGIPAATTAALQAGIFSGAQAVEVGLANRVQSFSALLATVASAKDGDTNMSKFDEARAALEEAAKGEGEEAAKAKKALAAMDEKDEPDAEGDDAPADEPKEEDSEAATEDDEEEEPAASAAGATVSASTAGELGATANTLAGRIAKLERDNEATARKAFLATRKDLSPDLLKVLRTKSLAECKAIVNAIPKPKVPARAASASVTGTRGDGQGDLTAARLAPEAKKALDIRMGLVSSKPGVSNTAHKLTLGAPASSAGEPGGKVA